MTSYLIGRYVRAISLSLPASADADRVVIAPVMRKEVEILKQLTRHYVIRNAGLAAQQRGQRQMIGDLFSTFHDAAEAKPSNWMRRVLPTAFGDALAVLEENYGSLMPTGFRARIAADAVAGLTEQQALDMHRRLSGYDVRSVFDPIVR